LAMGAAFLSLMLLFRHLLGQQSYVLKTFGIKLWPTWPQRGQHFCKRFAENAIWGSSPAIHFEKLRQVVMLVHLSCRQCHLGLQPCDQRCF
jgi:hypothetical protein